MRSLFENNINEELFLDSVISDVKDVKFKYDSITLVKSVGNYQCDVVLNDGIGFRGYRIDLDSSSSYPFKYKIASVKGQRLISKYQWENQ